MVGRLAASLVDWSDNSWVELMVDETVVESVAKKAVVLEFLRESRMAGTLVV
jgi:hypothetical protein